MKQRLIFAVALIACALSAMAADFEVEGICYDIIAPDAVEVAAGSYASGDVVIPSQVSYYGMDFAVTGIGEWAFQDNQDIHTVTLPNTLTSIAAYAFWSTGLTEVTIPESVTSIGEGAFHNCVEMTAIKGKFASADNNVLIANGTLIVMLPNAAVFSYTIPEGVTKIGHNAFEDCGNLKWVTIPGTVTAIGEYAFHNCRNLQSVTVPNSVKSIGNGVFCDCGNLESVTLPNGLKSIPYRTFTGCGNLEKVTLPDTLTTIGMESFMYCGNLTELIIPNSVKTIESGAFRYCGFTEIVIPDSVTSIGDLAFEGCGALTKITLPASLKRIEGETFYGCGNLTEINIPDAVEYIDDRAFVGCGALKSVTGPNVYCDDTCLIVGDAFMRLFPEANLASYTIPANVTRIADDAFRDCTSLESVDIPAGVTEIGNSCFANCSSLQSVVIPDGVTTIRSWTFSSCSSLTSITLPEGVRDIENHAFYDCTSLESITLPESLANVDWDDTFTNCSSLSAFYGRYATDDHRCLIDGDTMYAAAYAGLTEFTVPDGVKHIIGNCFEHGACELSIIHLPNTLEVVDGHAFRGLTNMTTITLPNSLKALESVAFQDAGIQYVTIPASVERLGPSVFAGCPLLSVTMESEDPWSISCEDETFGCTDVMESGTLYVPVGTKDLYSAHWFWSRFRNIDEGAGTAPNRFTAETTKVTLDEVSLVPVTMINDACVIGMQFDVMLPDGIVLAQNDKGHYYLEGSDRFDDHTVSAQEIDGGARFVVYSPTNTEFADHDGVLFSLPVIATGEPRQADIMIRNILLADASHQEIRVPSVITTANVQMAYTLCDVNGDGRFTVTDVTMVVAYVLGSEPAGSIRQAADANGDGRFTVTDVTLVVARVLGQGSKAPARIKGVDTETINAERSEISLADNGKVELSISGIGTYTSAQFDILPIEGVTIHGVSLRDAEGGNHTMAISNNTDGSVRVLAYSLDNSCFAAGAVFEIEIEGTGSIELAVDGIRLAQIRGNAVDEVSAEGCTANFDLSGIAGSMVDGLAVKVSTDGLVVTAREACVVTIYDTLGRAFSRSLTAGANHIALPKGVYMIGNRKAVVR